MSPASAVWLHQAVDFHIIGCGIPNTEIELLLAMAEVGGIPLFPTARLHVDAAVDVALESRPTPGLSVRDRSQGLQPATDLGGPYAAADADREVGCLLDRNRGCPGRTCLKRRMVDRPHAADGSARSVHN